MRPKTELVEQTELNTLRIIKVSLEPSPLGRFVVNAESYGERAVSRIRIIAMTQDEKEALHAGDDTPLKEHVQPDLTEAGRFEFVNCRAEVDIFDDATNSWGSAVVKSFVEMVPVPHSH